jgi:hypothetical protein
VLLALVAIRAPYVAGLFKTTDATGPGVGPVSLYPTAVEHTPIQTLASEPPQPVAVPPVAEPPAPVPPATVQATHDPHVPLEQHPSDRGHEPDAPPPVSS